MLRIDKDTKRLVRLPNCALADANHWERKLQSMICANPEAFCEELAENLLIIGQEIRPSETVPDRIDILAIDDDGNTVVIELKRGTHKLQLLQAISYAGMLARWSPDRFVDALGQNSRQSEEEARSAIENHTGGDFTSNNKIQRVLLIAEDFDPAALVACEWLHGNYGVDIRCYRLQLSQEFGSDYLTCTCIYPPIEIASLTRRRDTGPPDGTSASAWTNWADALKAVENPAVREFFNAELQSNQESRLRYRELMYRVADKRRYWVRCRSQYAYVWQRGRFAGDENFWRKLISKPASIGIRKGVSGGSLRFHLITANDFSAFKVALSDELHSVEYFALPDDEADESSD